MAAKGHQIKEEVDIDRFLQTINQYSENQIECSSHAFFRLSEGQRKVFICRELVKILLHEKPIFAGLQRNGNYAVFYEYRNDVLRIIIDILPSRIEIITFYVIDKVPKI